MGRAVPQASSALACLGLVYCFWIAYADLDGFRIDAAKHMGAEALRAFCDVIREFAQSIGKERLPPGRRGVGRPRASPGRSWRGPGLDAALGIDDVPGKLERMVTATPTRRITSPSSATGSWTSAAGHRWYRNQVVTLVDDHDQVRKGGASGGSAATADTATWPST